MLTNKQIEKFQAIFRELNGIEISKQEALLEGEKLVRLMRVIYQPITKKQHAEIEKLEEKEQNINKLA